MNLITEKQRGSSLDTLRLLDMCVRNKPTCVKGRVSIQLPGYGAHSDEIADIFGLDTSPTGTVACLFLGQGDKGKCERLQYNFAFISKGLLSTLEVLYDYDQSFYQKFTTKQMFSFFRSFWSLTLSEESVFDNPLKVMKYFTCFPLARYMNNDLPPLPKGLVNIYLFTGKIRSYLKQRLVSHNKKNCKLWWTFLQGLKRGCKEAPPWVVEASLRAHKETLSRETKVDDPSFFEEFKVKCRKLVKGFRYNPKPDLEISNSACWEAKRSLGGAHDFVLSWCNDLMYTMSEEFGTDTARIYDDRLIALNYTPTKGMIETRGLYSPFLGECLMVSSDLIRDQELDDMRNDVELTKGNPELRVQYQAKCMVSAVLEPLKVRLITKGEAFPYYYARSLQKDMHSFLRKKKQFSLIGEPLREDHLYQMVEQERALGLDFNLYVSADYSAATDNLKSVYTKAAFEAFLDVLNISEVEKEILRSVLYEHKVHYGNQFIEINKELLKLNPDLTNLEPFVQKNGQLMGSVLSFPILNVCNAVAYWISLERHTGRRFSFEDLPVLTNGDDCLFRTNDDHYSIWKECVKEVGFDLSVGKNYVHKNLLTVNSKLYRVSRDEFYEVQYFNIGLLMGDGKIADTRENSVKRKCKKGDYEKDDTPFSANYNIVISGADQPERAHARFIFYNKDQVLKYTDKGRISLSLPYHLGGLNCRVPEGSSYITDGQARVARHLSMLIQQNKDLPFVSGFVTEGRGNQQVVLIERSVDKYMFGFGPFEEDYVPLEDKVVSYNNSSLVMDHQIKYRLLDRGKFYELAKNSPAGLWYEEREPIALMKRYGSNSTQISTHLL